MSKKEILEKIEKEILSGNFQEHIASKAGSFMGGSKKQDIYINRQELLNFIKFLKESINE